MATPCLSGAGLARAPDGYRWMARVNRLLIVTPPLVMYTFSNRQIVAGLTAGAVKG